MEAFPRPYKTLLVSGWVISHGAIVKTGVVRVSDSDEPEGRIVIDNCGFEDTLFPSFIDTNDQVQVALTLVCVLILSREDVQQELGAWGVE